MRNAERIWHEVFSSALEYCSESFNTMLNPSPPPAVVVLTLIRLNDHLIETSDSRAVLPLNPFFLAQKMALWPVYRKEMDRHFDSLKKLADDAEGKGLAGYVGKGVKDGTVRTVASRYASLFSCVTALSGEAEEAMVFSRQVTSKRVDACPADLSNQYDAPPWRACAAAAGTVGQDQEPVRAALVSVEHLRDCHARAGRRPRTDNTPAASERAVVLPHSRGGGPSAHRRLVSEVPVPFLLNKRPFILHMHCAFGAHSFSSRLAACTNDAPAQMALLLLRSLTGLRLLVIVVVVARRTLGLGALLTV